jgi:hypothetical protein
MQQVSAIVPTYNNPRRFAAATESARANGSTLPEILVADGGCTEATHDRLLGEALRNRHPTVLTGDAVGPAMELRNWAARVLTQSSRLIGSPV